MATFITASKTVDQKSTTITRLSQIKQRDLLIQVLAARTPPITGVKVVTIDAAFGQEADVTVILTSRTGGEQRAGFLSEKERFIVSATSGR
jgi:hypothetical protein